VVIKTFLFINLIPLKAGLKRALDCQKRFRQSEKGFGPQRANDGLTSELLNLNIITFSLEL
jgi:hypothetical protein